MRQEGLASAAGFGHRACLLAHVDGVSKMDRPSLFLPLGPTRAFRRRRPPALTALAEAGVGSALPLRRNRDQFKLSPQEYILTEYISAAVKRADFASRRRRISVALRR